MIHGQPPLIETRSAQCPAIEPGVLDPSDQAQPNEQLVEAAVFKTILHDYYLSHRPAQAEIAVLHPYIFDYMAGYYHRAWGPAERNVLLDRDRFERAVGTPMTQRIDRGIVQPPKSHLPAITAGHDPADDFTREWDCFTHSLREAAFASTEPADPISHALLLTRIASGIAGKDLEYQSKPRAGGLGSKAEVHASILRDWVVIAGRSSGSAALDAMYRDLGTILKLKPSASDDELLRDAQTILLADGPPSSGVLVSRSPLLPTTTTLRRVLTELAESRATLQAAWRYNHPGQRYDPAAALSRGARVAHFMTGLAGLVTRNDQ